MAGPLRVLDLFSGIGGFSLGLKRAGMTTVAFCEIDPFCRRVLAKHWPDVPCHEDITKLRGSDVGTVDVVCGGFPCQDISVAGKGAGLAGERSGLFYELARLIGELRPRYAILENVSALLSRGLGDVLGELATLGYDAEWHCIPAASVGAPHRRDRVWVVAYPKRNGCNGTGQAWQTRQRLPARGCGGQSNPWQVEPDVGRVADGVPARTHRLRALGNAAVPAIPELIGRAILEVEGRA